MNKKLECVRDLKSKLSQMQRELQRIQQTSNHSHNSRSRSRSPNFLNQTQNVYHSHSITSPMTKSRNWKNPTFFGPNPISPRAAKYNTSLISSRDGSRTKNDLNYTGRKQAASRMALTMKSQTSNINNIPNNQCHQMNNYFQSIEKTSPRFRMNMVEERKQRSPSPKFAYSFHGGANRGTPKVQKIRTYHQPYTNPILSPERSLDKGKKMVIQIPRTPTSNLIENPRSNPSLYVFNDKVTSLTPKSFNWKNISPQISDIMSSSLERASMVNTPKKTNCKKHFSRYFEETYIAQWN